MIPSSKENGQVLIGLIISIGLLSILSLTIITLVFSSYDLLNYTSARTTAKYIATEQMEIIRNLAYNDVGTVGGIPPGILSQDQTEIRNGLPYTINTSVVYYDDPFDQTAPDDLLPTDYKKVRVDVSWGGLAASRSAPVTLISDIAPKGAETSTGGGTLSILVFDSQGLPVSGANVHIEAAVTPNVNLNLQTNQDGRVLLPGAPACSNSCYKITVTREGFSSDRTYSTTEVSTPAKPNQNVLATKLTEVSFAIDRLSTLTIKSTGDKASNFAPLPSQPFTLRSDKIIGTDAQDNPVYKYNQNLTTGANGEIVVTDLEWGTYQFTPSNSSQDNAGTNPLLPLTIAANTTGEFRYANSNHTNHTLLLTFVDPAKTPVASVSAELNYLGAGVATVSSGLAPDPDFGQSFFSNLLARTYQLIATASGYATYSANISVNGQSQTQVILSQ